ncbi:MAG: enoyl-CoA hydratase [Pseudomonadota bacterium]
MTEHAPYQNILLERHGRVGLIALNRPQQRNALCEELVNELTQALDLLEASPDIGAIVITGSDTVFAAGADISALQNLSYQDAYLNDYVTRNWERVRSCRKPVIAAVAGYALGGGCELAMMCDFILAGENAQFGMPEIKLGTLPGAGGTQRLPRAIGKAKAMEMCLTGRLMDANEAECSGLVARVIASEQLRSEALACAQKIAEASLPAAMMIKETINRAFETHLNEGILFERRVFHASFALADPKEGMSAFLEKRKAKFKHR